jgi:Uncharacterized protein conserved in bacteria
MKQLISFFQEDPLRRDIIYIYPDIYQQATRQWLYRNSRFKDRLNIIQEHFHFFQERFSENALRRIYLNGGLLLWSEQYGDDKLSLRLIFSDEHKKEGLAGIELKLGEKRIYRIIFWIAPNDIGEQALWIGALQGSPGGQKTVHDLTKSFFGYRTKNLVLYGVRIFAGYLGLKRIYAVSNYGYYTYSHMWRDRKLKTSLDEFWREAAGTPLSDRRFFELPVVEPRKNIDDVKSHKRNLYKKRYALLDKIGQEIARGQLDSTHELRRNRCLAQRGVDFIFAAARNKIDFCWKINMLILFAARGCVASRILL